MTTAQVLVLILNLYGTTIVVFLVGAAFLGSIGYFIDAYHQDRIARAMRDCDVPAAAPATVPTPAPLQGRSLTNLANLQECYRRGHVYPDWARTDTGWICVRCEHFTPHYVEDLPFDQDAAQLVAEVDAYLTRRTA